MNTPHLSMSRYRNSRNWAVYNGPELLAVTVYRKGAEAIVNLIHNITSNTNNIDNTMSKNNKTAKSSKTAKKNTAAATSSAPEPVTVLVTAKHTKKNCRATLQYTQTRICRATKGAWKQDAYYGRPLNELVEKGAFKLANKRAKELFDAFYANVDPEAAAAEPDWVDAINDFECLKNAAAEAAPAEPEAPATGEAQQDDDDLNVVEAPAEQPEEEYRAELETARELELAEAAAAIEPEDERLAEFEAALEKAGFIEPEAQEAQEAEQPAPEAKAEAPAKASRPAPCRVILPGETEPQPIPADIELKPGTRLVRIFKGVTYEVDVTEAGFEWNGETYPTLTPHKLEDTPLQAGRHDILRNPRQAPLQHQALNPENHHHREAADEHTRSLPCLFQVALGPLQRAGGRSCGLPVGLSTGYPGAGKTAWQGPKDGKSPQAHPGCRHRPLPGTYFPSVSFLYSSNRCATRSASPASA